MPVASRGGCRLRHGRRWLLTLLDRLLQLANVVEGQFTCYGELRRHMWKQGRVLRSGAAARLMSEPGPRFVTIAWCALMSACGPTTPSSASLDGQRSGTTSQGTPMKTFRCAVGLVVMGALGTLVGPRLLNLGHFSRESGHERAGGEARERVGSEDPGHG
jgi:hypothetical protein